MASRDRHLEVDDIPPPPYSETDIYSNASPTTNTHPGRHPSSTDTDDASTTNGEVIYTPPLTPRSSSHNSQRNQGFASHLPSDDDFLSTAGGATPTDVTTRSNANSSPSLAAYFQSRRHSLPVTQLVEWTIVVKDDGTTVPDDLPYPEEQGAEARGVMGEDWMTFLNYLLPDHLEQTNKRVVDRKLAAEGLSPSSSHEERDRSPAERQLLEAIRGGRPVGNDGETPQARREKMENMVREWNDGFFEKRGITVRLEIKGGEPRGMPGAYPLSYEQPQPQPQPQQQPQQQSGQNRGGMFGRWSPGNMFGYGSGGNQQNGFNLGGIKVEGERVSIGNNFVADGRSGYLKIGGIVADSNGISINGWNPMHAGRGGRGSCRDMRGGCGGRRGGAFAPPGMGSWGAQDSSSSPGWHPPLWGGGRGWRGFDGGRGQSGHHYFGRGGRGSWLGSYFGQPPAPAEGQAEGQPQPQQGQGVEQGVMQPEQDRGRGREGRKHSHGRRHKSRSSSVSSASSSSSSSSESSVGSLPDYDDLKDTQLPIARQYLTDSLHHPEQQITREKVKQVKEQIRAARNANVNQTVNIVHDRAALRREFKELMRGWKQLKKEQRKQHLQLRKERRQRRKEEKRERRNTRREMRRAEKDFRRNGRGPTHPHTDLVDCWQHPEGSSTACFSPPPLPVPPSVPPFVQGPWFNGSNPNSVFMHPHMPRGMNPPGAWPTENNNHVQTPPEHRASIAMYKALGEMDAEITAKEAELLKLHEEIAGTEQGASRGDGAAPYWPSAETEKAALHVEKEIEELALKMEKLRTEADEAFARELAREEEELARVS